VAEVGEATEEGEVGSTALLVAATRATSVPLMAEEEVVGMAATRSVLGISMTRIDDHLTT
jgi:hypothetical protein